MKILFLTDNFPPESNAPASRTYEHAKYWVKAGHEVVIITGAPNFPEGKVYKGYKNSWHTKEVIDGIEVHRVKTFISANDGFVLRIIDFVSFMISSFFCGLFIKKPDVIVATSPQFFTACAGYMLGAVKRRPFVFELRDIWPASITAVGAMKDSIAIKLLEKIEMFLYQRAACIISVTEAFKKELSDRGVDRKKIKVVRNGVELSHYQAFSEKDSKLAEEFNLAGKFVVGYIGTHGKAHALEDIVSVAENLKDKPDIHFIFVGGGAERERIESLVAQKMLANVSLIPRQKKEQMPAVWSLCDISLVPLRDAELFRTVIPSKIFECMGMGIPILMSVPEGEATSIIQENKVGIVVKAQSISEIEQGILNLKEKPEKLREISSNALAVAPGFSREKLAHQMLGILNDLS